jgi:hypothetical protein
MALLLCCVPRGLADTITFHLNSPPSNNVWDGIYVGPYDATTLAGAHILIIRDDFKDESNYNTYSYAVHSFGNLVGTLWGGQPNAATLYQEAAWLTVGLYQKTDVTQAYYSYAIWAVFDPSDASAWLRKYNDAAACNYIFGQGNNCASPTVSAGGLLYRPNRTMEVRSTRTFSYTPQCVAARPLSATSRNSFTSSRCLWAVQLCCTCFLLPSRASTP